MNQQEETEITEKGEQKLKGGKAGGGQGTEKGNIRACLIQAMADLSLRYLRCLLFSSKALAESRLQRIHSSGKVSPMTRNIRWWRLNALRELNLKVDAVISPKR